MRSSCARPTNRALAALFASLLLFLGADPADDPAKTLAAVQKRYDSVRDLRASFVQRASPALNKETEAAAGLVQRPADALGYAKPDGRVIVLDGSAIRIWSPEKQLQIAPLSLPGVSPTAQLS